MKTTQLFRLISIINSLFIIPACSAQNPSQSIIEDILKIYLLIIVLIMLLMNPTGRMNWKNCPSVFTNL